MAGYLPSSTGRRGAAWIPLAIAFCMLAVLPRLASAAPVITYEAIDLADTGSGDLWRYDYSIEGFTVNDYIDIIFDYSLYEFDLFASPIASSGVSAFLTPPDSTIFIDGLLQISPAFSGTPSSIETVSIEFTWLGSGTPGSQAVDLYDFSSIGNFLVEGQTSPAQAAVPEPPLILLLATGCLLLASRRCEFRCY